MGDGYRESTTTRQTDPDLLSGLMQCPRWVPQTLASQVTDGSGRLFSAPRGHFDGQTVLRLGGDNAHRLWQMLNASLTGCKRLATTAEQGTPVSTEWAVLANGFAGTESMALRVRGYRGNVLSNTDFFVLVRRTDVVTTFWLSDQRWTTPQLVALGQRAAFKLCRVTSC